MDAILKASAICPNCENRVDVKVDDKNEIVDGPRYCKAGKCDTSLLVEKIYNS